MQLAHGEFVSGGRQAKGEGHAVIMAGKTGPSALVSAREPPAGGEDNPYREFAPRRVGARVMSTGVCEGWAYES